MAEYTSELAFAREVAALGARIAMGHYGRNPETKRKTDGTWVTEADWAAEAQIRLRIARAYPDHNILGEEEGLTAAGGGAPRNGAPTWIVDPIDGTNNFLAGIPMWATLVALQVDGKSVVGACHAPALSEQYDAALGSGARMNGEPIAVAEIDDLSEATVLGPGLEAFVDEGLFAFYSNLVTGARRSRGFGDFWGHMLVARGAAHIMIEPGLRLWDYSALEPIVQEAGGRMSRLDGRPCTDGGSCLTTNGRLHAQVLELAYAHPQRKNDERAVDERR